MQRIQKKPHWESVRPVFAFPFLVRLRDHGAWPTLSHISHFLSRIFYLASRIFISHFYLASRIFYLAFTSRIFFSFFIKSHLECPLQASVLTGFRKILNNRNAIFSLCEASCEAQFKPDVTSFFVGWCIYEKCPAPEVRRTLRNYCLVWLWQIPACGCMGLPGPTRSPLASERG